MLTVGYTEHELPSVFRLHSVAGRGRHKFRPPTLSLAEYLASLQHVQLCPVLGDPDYSHPTVTRNEAARIFADLAGGGQREEGGFRRDDKDLLLDEAGFEECLSRIVRLCGLKRVTDVKKFGVLDKEEERLVDLQVTPKT